MQTLPPPRPSAMPAEQSRIDCCSDSVLPVCSQVHSVQECSKEFASLMKRKTQTSHQGRLTCLQLGL